MAIHVLRSRHRRSFSRIGSLSFLDASLFFFFDFNDSLPLVADEQVIISLDSQVTLDVFSLTSCTEQALLSVPII